VRAATASLLGRLAGQPLHGPRVALLLGRLLPPGLVAALLVRARRQPCTLFIYPTAAGPTAAAGPGRRVAGARALQAAGRRAAPGAHGLLSWCRRARRGQREHARAQRCWCSQDAPCAARGPVGTP
jgi:hypothetical protein